jgi:hypothetical protein
MYVTSFRIMERKGKGWWEGYGGSEIWSKTLDLKFLNLFSCVNRELCIITVIIT